MKTNTKKTGIIILSILFPLTILGIVMGIDEIFPFGDKTMFLWDLEIQYWKPYVWLHDVLHGETGFTYTFSQALGGNMYSTATVYLFSPFNLLVYFFDTEHMAEFFSLVTVLKISTCGLTSYIYLDKRFSINSECMKLLCSTAYALMEYNVSLCSNIHFLDAIYTLPIVCLGVYYLVNGKRRSVLFISVIYAIMTDWYIGYMVCLFSIFYFVFELSLRYRYKTDFKICAKKTGSYITTLAGGTCASAAFLIPGLVSAALGKGQMDLAYLKPSFHCDPLYILRSLFITSEGNVSYEQPGIYVSSLVLVISVMFYLDKRIDRRSRFLCGMLTLFIFIGFSFVPLEIVWTMLKKTYSFHFRFAYIFSFILVMTAGMYLDKIDCEDRKVPLKIFAGAGGGLALYFLVQNLVESFRGEKIIYYFVGLIICFSVGLYVLLGRFKNHKIIGRITCGVIIAMFFCEQIYNVDYTFSKYSISDSDFKEYVSDTENAINEIKDGEETAFRMEKTFSEMTNRRGSLTPSDSEGLAFSYNGLSYYSSVYNAKTFDFLAYMGYCRQGAMATNYVDTNMVMDTLLGVKYTLTDIAPSVYEKTTSDSLPDGQAIYKNSYALSLGTIVNSAVSNFEWSADNNPFTNQQMFVDQLLGTKESNLFTNQNWEESYEDGKRVWTVQVETSGPLYCYWKSGHAETSIYVNDEFKQIYFARFYKNIVYLGDYDVGDKVVIAMDDAADCSSEHGFEVRTINVSSLEETVDLLQQNGECSIQIDGSKVMGSVDVKQDGVLWLSIPYDSGWTIRLNGEKVEYKEILNGLIGVDISEGEYVLEMSYFPPYLAVSLVISIVAIVLFIVWNKRSEGLKNKSKKEGARQNDQI